MRRRDFVGAAATLSLQLLPPGEVSIERPQPGKPHAGRVLAAIQPHADDIPLFRAGLVLMLVDEGYTGYLIRTTNDDMTGPGGIGEGVLANQRDNFEVARALGLRQIFDLNYGNRRMDGIPKPELRCRLIFLFRLLRVDTVVSFDPWCPFKEDPDHYVTARYLEAACRPAGAPRDYPEHFAAGRKPHAVRERYYYARGPQRVNRLVVVGSWMDRKVEVSLLNRAQGPAGATGARLRRSLAEKGLRLPLLNDEPSTAGRRLQEFVLARDRELGRCYGLEYAEAYHDIGPRPSAVYIGPRPSAVDDSIRRYAVPRKP